MTDVEYLLSRPTPALERSVKRHLGSYGIRIRPELWRLTWEWANAVRDTYGAGGRHWPPATEIGAQYVALLLNQMRGELALKLPSRAMDPELMPANVRRAIELATGTVRRFALLSSDPPPRIGVDPPRTYDFKVIDDLAEKSGAEK